MSKKWKKENSETWVTTTGLTPGDGGGARPMAWPMRYVSRTHFGESNLLFGSNKLENSLGIKNGPPPKCTRFVRTAFTDVQTMYILGVDGFGALWQFNFKIS